MGTIGRPSNPIAVHAGDVADYQEGRHHHHPPFSASSITADQISTTTDQKQLDAGALFVLKSKGSWIHCGYHLTTSIVAPPLLSLPYAFASLGWVAGVVCLIIGALVTFYSYNLISLVLEHHAQLGRRHLRFRDMAVDILGPNWGRYYVGPIQLIVCYGAVVGSTLLGGQCMKTIYLLSSPDDETMKLYHFVIIFGGLLLILAQIPSFHSLRHINLIALLLCLAYSACATAGSIYVGNSSKAPPKDYSLRSNGVNRVFGVFNAIAIIATTFGNGIIPEIQATLAPPVKGKMFKGLSVCYTVVIATFFSVAISGYWAFGNNAAGIILTNFLDENGNSLVPKWFLLMTNVFTLLQLSAVSVVYLQPTNELLERQFCDPKSTEFSARNVIPRLISRSLSVVLAATIAAMLPFFGDINALIGAFGFMPLDFTLPVVFFNLTFRPSQRKPVFWLNTTIAVVFSTLAVIAGVAAVRQIVLDANTYRLFANFELLEQVVVQQFKGEPVFNEISNSVVAGLEPRPTAKKVKRAFGNQKQKHFCF
ncbi:Amino acid transporter [Macleaya cordata]|uniref:Amino acid transporter n=1 Tax=Macleaya cordata TaxID=56857 RepID=A0A200R577_MACCD|nr:Amino acid transporter [Macleaya cordata]